VRRAVVAVLALLLGLGAAGAPLAGQRGPRLEVRLPPPQAQGTEGPFVRGIDIVDDRQMRDLIRSGFPARLHYKVELWSSTGLFDDLERSTAWDVVVRYDPLGKSYRVFRYAGDHLTLLGEFARYEEAQGAAERLFQAPLSPRGKRSRLYYNVTLDVETMSLSDLNELERWLKGELRPAVRGERNPGTAVTRGLRTLFVRMLGGERRHYELRSPTFRPP
jgi:hypothetical protein